MNAKHWYRVFALAAISLSLVTVAGIWHLGSNSMIACGWFGAFLIHAGKRPPGKHLLSAVFLAVGFASVYVFLGGKFAADPLVFLPGAGAFLGIGSIVVLSYERVWCGLSRNTGALRDALILPAFSFVAGLFMPLVNGHLRHSFDYWLYAYDSALGTAPGRDVTRLFDRLPWLGATCSAIYSTLLIFPPFFHAWASYSNRKTRTNLMFAFVVAGVVGGSLYQVCPAMGPLYAFPVTWPGHLPASVPLQEIASVSANNAMPSMHMTWALLVWWAAWEIGPLAIGIATAFVGLTALATVGFGEHYLIDLFVSVPLAMAVEGICTKRHTLTITGLAFVLGWTVLLRFGTLLPLPSMANWLLVVGTIVATLTVMRLNWIGRPAAFSRRHTHPRVVTL